MLFLVAFLCLAAAVAEAAVNIPLVTFDGASGTTFKFTELNDPVMGGQSTGTWAVNTTGEFGIFDGKVATVPSLKAPGFIKTAADGKFPDASPALAGGLVLTVRTSTPDYAGFRVAFASGTMSPSYSCAGGGSLPFSRGCYKTNFTVPAGVGWSAVHLPFHRFSDKWSPATGEQTSTCADDKDVCPSVKTLAGIKRIEVWAEGANGEAHLEIASISAIMDDELELDLADVRRDHRPPKEFNNCVAAVQDPLLYNISSRTDPGVPIPVDLGESLAEAICCDRRATPYAEPQFLFEAPDIQLFAKMSKDGVTTFYDTVCGLPVFRAPVNRSMADFQADTQEHGWPSFRTAEIVAENIITNTTTTFVTSKCGTHLGSYLPDDNGPRWCIDLSCIAGSSAPSRQH